MVTRADPDGMLGVDCDAGTVGLREVGMIGILAGFGVAVAPATIGALLLRAAMIVGAGLGLGLSSPAVSTFAKPLPEAV